MCSYRATASEQEMAELKFQGDASDVESSDDELLSYQPFSQESELLLLSPSKGKRSDDNDVKADNSDDDEGLEEEGGSRSDSNVC